MRKQHTTQIPADLVAIGKMGSAYGIRGWIKVFSFTEHANNIFNYHPWFIQIACKWRKIELEDWKYHNQYMIIKAKDIDDRDTASYLTNSKILIDVLQLPVLEEGNYYWKDLIGCNVITINGYNMGKIIDLMKIGSTDILVVKANIEDSFGIKERLIPFLNEKIIKKIDLITRFIEVDWHLNF